MQTTDLIMLPLWWAYFSSLHYLLRIKGRCPDAIAPLAALASVVMIMNLTAIVFRSLHPGFFILLGLGVMGFLVAVKDYGCRFYRAFIEQPKVIWFFYFLALLSFVQNMCLGNGFRHPDDFHHWALIIKGMGNYHALNCYPRMSGFDNYTVGSALWGYFTNRFFLSPFRAEITNWANCLISVFCLVPTLGFFNFELGKVPLSRAVFTVIGIAFIFLSGSFLSVAGWLIVLGVAVEAIISRRQCKLETLAFLAWLLVYLSLMVLPYMELSYYRTLPPDHLIYCSAAAILLGYMADRSMASILWLSFCLVLPYLFKRPGLFLSVTVAVMIGTHFLLIRRKLISKLIRKRNALSYRLLGIVLSLLFFLAAPPLAWNGFCKATKANGSFKVAYGKGGIGRIADCFTSQEKLYRETRYNFFNRFYRHSVLNLKPGIADFGVLLAPFSKLSLDWLFSPDENVTYPKVLFFLVLLQIASLLTMHWRKKYWIMPFLMLLFTVIHICGLITTYCLSFGGDSVIPAYSRYAAPLLKLNIAFTSGLLLLAFLEIRKNSRRLLAACFMLLISINLLLSSHYTLHVNPSTFKSVESLSNVIPDSVDFREKKVLCLGDFGPRPFDTLGLLSMCSQNFSPRLFADVPRTVKVLNSHAAQFDLFFWFQDRSGSPTANTNRFRAGDIVASEELEEIKNACILEKAQSKGKFRILYFDEACPTNLIQNADFANGLDNWTCRGKVQPSIVNYDNGNGVRIPKGVTLKSCVNLQSNHYYLVSLQVNAAKENSVVGKIGDQVLRTNAGGAWKTAKLIFLCDNGRKEELVISFPYSDFTEYRDFKILDLGERKNNKGATN